ncbi:MAG: hypothetical protein V1813_01190, partial [Candidatus Aenigmatarchaeota archaeon]
MVPQSRKMLLIAIPMLALLAAQAAPAAALTAEIIPLFPANGSWNNSAYGALPFTFIFSDPDYTEAQCYLHVNATDVGPVPVENGTVGQIFLPAAPAQGHSRWNVSCDNGGSRSSADMDLFYDSEAPSVQLSSPADGAAPGTITMNAAFNFSDALSGSAGCLLRANGTAMKALANVQNGTESYMVFAWGQNGTYHWNVSCTDLAGNTGTAAERVVHVTLPMSMDVSSPGNTTYDSDYVNLTFSVYFPGGAFWMGYRLDGGTAVTVTGNTTIAVPAGSHAIEVIANETAAASQSSTVHFTMDPDNPISLDLPTDVFAANTFTVNAHLSTGATWCNAS